MSAAMLHSGPALRFVERVASWSKKHPDTVEESLDALILEHGRRVARLTFDLCRFFGASALLAQSMARCSMYHDIGKLRLSPYLLFFPGVLTEIEVLALRQHTVMGGALALEVFSGTAAEHQVLADICRHHHEQWDGSGYPDRLCGPDIPFAARVVAVADVFDSLVSGTAQRAAVSPVEALRKMNRDSGTHFDPDVVEALESLVESGLAGPDYRSAHPTDGWLMGLKLDLALPPD